jgi:hypothetical protein
MLRVVVDAPATAGTYIIVSPSAYAEKASVVPVQVPAVVSVLGPTITGIGYVFLVYTSS